MCISSYSVSVLLNKTSQEMFFDPEAKRYIPACIYMAKLQCKFTLQTGEVPSKQTTGDGQLHILFPKSRAAIAWESTTSHGKAN